MDVKKPFALMKSLKPDFIEMLDRLSVLPGGSYMKTLTNELATGKPEVAVRTNKGKGIIPPLSSLPVSWNNAGFYIEGERPSFTFDPAMHQGLYYVQDASSMIVGTIAKKLFRKSWPVVAIDACAAPGGKTTAVIDNLPAESFIIANEFDYGRAEILRENLIKWGNPNILISRGDTNKFSNLRDVADLIVADVPCSGEGMMRKDDEAVSQWSANLVENCAALQRKIVENIWPALKPGGYLIYSTCTFNLEENEKNIEKLSKEFGASIVPIRKLDPVFSKLPGAIDSHIDCLRFIPGVTKGEGLFVCVLQKQGTRIDMPLSDEDNRDDKKSKKQRTPIDFSSMLDGEFQFETIDNQIYAIPTNRRRLIHSAETHLDVIYKGIEIGQIKGNDFIPAHSLALSTALRTEVLNTCEVDYQSALKYLQRQAVSAPMNAKRGLLLLTYKNVPLGFVKNIGNRCNNLLPKNFAIKSTHVPDGIPRVVNQ